MLHTYQEMVSSSFFHTVMWLMKLTLVQAFIILDKYGIYLCSAVIEALPVLWMSMHFRDEIQIQNKAYCLHCTIAQYRSHIFCDPLQIAWNFNIMFDGIFWDYAQNFTQIYHVLFELEVFEGWNHSCFFTFVSLFYSTFCQAITALTP